MSGRRRLVNVCFHGIGTPRRELEPGEEHYWVGVDRFQRVLDVLVDRPEVRVSFDDGNWSDVEHGLPALLERGMTATFFVLAGRLGEPGSLDEDAVRHLVAQGMRIGSHGMDHVSWRDMDAPTARRELTDARDRLASVVGMPVTEAACPRGQYDGRGLRQLRSAGYRTVHNSDRAWACEGAWLQPRFSVHGDDTPDSVVAGILARPSVVRRVERSAVGLVKRLR